MKKLLFMFVYMPCFAQAIEITLPSEIVYFDVQEALNKLGESLQSNSISEQKARLLYTVIYTKAIFKRAETIKNERTKRKHRLGNHIEPISYEDATRKAIKDVESALIAPENSICVYNKIARYIPVRELLS